MKVHHPRTSVTSIVCGSAALLLAGHTSLLAQRFSITNIVVPEAASLSVAAMNASGQLAGYCYTLNSEQRAFFWDHGSSLDLGTLGGSTSVGNALNNYGQVVGYSSSVGDSEYHGFLGIGHTLFDLGTLGGTVSSATSVSDAGYVTGYSHVSPLSVDYHAFLKANNSVMADLGTLGGSTSSGTSVNNLGQVVGSATTAGNAETHAFLHDGAMHDLGTLGGTYSSAAALNDGGLVTGESSTAGETETHAFLFDGAGLHDLGTLGGTYSSGYAINDAGVVIGDSSLAGDADYHGFVYRHGTLQDLGTLGGSFSSSWRVNNSDQVVGVSANAAGRHHAFLWVEGVMIDLNSTLPPDSGWELTGAYFINDNGQISGEGLYQGQPSWFLLTPQPENHPPVANAGADQTVPASGSSAQVTVDGSASSDPDGDTLTFAWSENGVLLGSTANLTLTLAAGTHHLLLTVTDPQQASAQDEVVVVVVTGDITPPVVGAIDSITRVARGDGLATVPNLRPRVRAYDDLTPTDELNIVQNPSAGTKVGPGSHTILLTVTDRAGNATTVAVSLNVIDLTPPRIRLVTVNPEVLSPADGRMVQVQLELQATDNCDPNPRAHIASVACNEPGSDGAWEITGDLQVQLRAEVLSKRCGRIYMIRVACTDSAGNTSYRRVLVRVPRNKVAQTVASVQ